MKNKYIYGILLSVFFSACSDFLDETPHSNLQSDEAITTVTDLRNAINGVAFFQTENRMTYASEYGIYADLRGEDFKYVRNYGQSTAISLYNLTKNDELPYWGYYYFYKGIANVNKAIEAALIMEVDAADKDEYDNYVGELYAWRALLHFDLARMFCNAPTASDDINAANSGIVLSKAVYPTGHVAARSTLKQTYDQILDDIKFALPLLDDAVSNGRLNYWGALALRSRVYLYLGENDLALDDAEEVIGSTSYSLYTVDNYASVWGLAFTSEALIELAVTVNYNPQRNSLGYFCDPSGYPECAFEETAPLYTYLIAHPEDIRSKLIKVQAIGANTDGKYPAKYPGRDNNLYVNNPKIIRLSDVYLIAAEAAFKEGDDTKALKYYNDLRRNRITPYTDATSITLEDIIFERRIELFAENSSTFDYFRNKLSVNSKYRGKIEYNDYRTILPIPQDEIDIAPEVLIQNPKY